MSSAVPPSVQGNGDDPEIGDTTTTGRGSHRAAKPHSPRRPRGPRRLLPGPAVLGVATLVVAGVGVVRGADDVPTEVTHEPSALAAPLAATPDPRDPNAPEVSRSISRATLNRQAETQAGQRQQALKEIRSKSQDRADQLLKEKKRQERLKEKREKEKEKKAEAAEEQGQLASGEGDNDSGASGGQWVLPVAGYSLTATFGESSSYWSTTHTGLDFAAGSGTPLVAVSSGTVSETGYDGSYGNKTVLTLDDGTEIWYCHQDSINVSSGESVEPGQEIGTVGGTGNVTGPHLHLEVRPGGGEPVDPESALQEHGVDP